FQQAAEAPAESKDATAASISGGGLLAAGNSNSVAVTAAADVRVRRGSNEFAAIGAVNQTHVQNPDTDEYEPTVNNTQGRVRYDYFVAENLSTFIQLTGRNDEFQGLILRMNVDPGLAYYFVNTEKAQFRLEGGYDFQFDSRYDSFLNEIDEAERPDKTEARHAARVALDYSNNINEDVGFRTGLEYLQGLSPFRSDTTDRVNLRLNCDAALAAKVSDKFTVSTSLFVKYDNNPFSSEIRRTDVQTALNLVYTLM